MKYFVFGWITLLTIGCSRSIEHDGLEGSKKSSVAETSFSTAPTTKTSKPLIADKPKVSFTFDDGSTEDIGPFKFVKWNKMILTALEDEKLTATFFVKGQGKETKRGRTLLKSWNDKGHAIANHTFTHPYFNSKKNTVELFEEELLLTDALISKYENHTKLFRFPYLKEGEHPEKVERIRKILSQHSYENGFVTIDASDWYVNQRLIKRMKKVGSKNTEFEKFKEFYLGHIMQRAKFYEKLSYTMHQRRIKHSLLLHHNLTSALFLPDLIERFKDEGWDVVNSKDAFDDEIYREKPKAEFAGESLIWSLAKQSGNFDAILRSPAEDSRYEKAKMDELGL